jgi:septal ring factor EnvC (AmiA/AmiB activator)
MVIFNVTGCATMRYVPPRIPDTMSGIYHEVQRGETLWRLANAYNVKMGELVHVNRLPDASRINEGQLVFIPGAHQRLNTTQLYDKHNNFIWPIKGKVVSYFGSLKDGVKNKGIDIAGHQGAPVIASRSGRVSFVDDKVKGFGKTLILDHGGGYSSVYAYNSTILVAVGAYVRQGSAIAKVGRSGRAKGASLHFEIRKQHKPQNPFYYLP